MKTGNLSPTPMFAIHCSFQYSEGILKPHLLRTSKSKPLNVLGLVIARLFLLVRQFVFDFVYHSFLPFLLLVGIPPPPMNAAARGGMSIPAQRSGFLS